MPRKLACLMNLPRGKAVKQKEKISYQHWSVSHVRVGYTRDLTRLARAPNDKSYNALAVGSDNVEYASWISMKSRPSDDDPTASGWYIFARLRYATLISVRDAVRSTRSTSYRLPALLVSTPRLNDAVWTEFLVVNRVAVLPKLLRVETGGQPTGWPTKFEVKVPCIDEEGNRRSENGWKKKEEFDFWEFPNRLWLREIEVESSDIYIGSNFGENRFLFRSEEEKTMCYPVDFCFG